MSANSNIWVIGVEGWSIVCFSLWETEFCNLLLTSADLGSSRSLVNLTRFKFQTLSTPKWVVTETAQLVLLAFPAVPWHNTLKFILEECFGGMWMPVSWTQPVWGSSAPSLSLECVFLPRFSNQEPPPGCGQKKVMLIKIATYQSGRLCFFDFSPFDFQLINVPNFIIWLLKPASLILCLNFSTCVPVPQGLPGRCLLWKTGASLVFHESHNPCSYSLLLLVLLGLLRVAFYILLRMFNSYL